MLTLGKYKGALVATLPRHYMAFMLAWDHTADRPTAVPRARQKDVGVVRQHVLERRLCYLCCGRLQPLGGAPPGGPKGHGKAPHTDWLTRHYHKACWRDIMAARSRLCSCGTARIAVSRELKAFPTCDCKPARK